MNQDNTGLVRLFEGHPVRVLGTWNDPLWVAADVCKILGIRNPSKTLSEFEDHEKGITNSYTLGGGQELLTISEAGLYRLMFRSRKPEAQRFRKWVCQEVLPSIRKTGVYKLEQQTKLLEQENDSLKQQLSAVQDNELLAEHSFALVRWYRECVDYDPDAYTLTSSLHRHHYSYCYKRFYHPVASQSFRWALTFLLKDLKVDAYQDKDNQNKWIFRGLKLRS